MKPVFIGGADRSGTTFLAAEIARLEGVVAPPESSFLTEAALHALDGAASPEAEAANIARHYRFKPWREAGVPAPAAAMGRTGDMTARLERLVAAYADAIGAGPASVFVEHSPGNRRLSPRLVEAWPDMKFLHIVRDGRAVAASLIPVDWGPNTILEAALFWRRAVRDGLATVETLGPERAMTVRYERLVETPDDAFAEIFAFLGLEGRPRRTAGPAFRRPGYAGDTHKLVGTSPDAKGAARWRDRLTPRQIELFELAAGDALDSLGYRCICERDSVAPPGPIEKGAMKLAGAYLARRNAARYRRRHRL